MPIFPLLGTSKSEGRRERERWLFHDMPISPLLGTSKSEGRRERGGGSGVIVVEDEDGGER